MQRTASIRTLLLGAHAFVWLVPLAAVALMRTYDVHLLHQTELQLISESVVIGEAYREAWLKAQGRTHDSHLPPGERAPGNVEYHPLHTRIDFGVPQLPAVSEPLRPAHALDPTALRAGQQVEPLMRRAQTFNLSGIRLLDAQGCVVATTRGDAGLCMDMQPEVRSALGGRYDAVLRERVSDEPLPPLGDIRRRGSLRVFTALPVFSDGRVIGVVRASRTGLDALSSLWAKRRGLLGWTLAGTLFWGLLSVAFSAAIARPLRKLTHAARRVAQGASARELALSGAAPNEIAELQGVLHGMAERLETSAHYVREFASQVSHELKTPITAIRGAAELLHQLDDMPAAARQRFLANIEEDARRMERLVSRLLELARAENVSPQAQASELDAGELARAQLARHANALVLVTPTPCPIAIAEEQLVAVLTSLVDNALRHGAGKPVRVELANEHGKLRIDVTDQGAGVSEANRKRLFERFFTTERDRGGTGLGLAIIKAIAESRGGTARACFDERGTTFTVVL